MDVCSVGGAPWRHRSGVNYNDGAMGGDVMEVRDLRVARVSVCGAWSARASVCGAWVKCVEMLVKHVDAAFGAASQGNVLLNFVKESNDHGPFNSWDRQPYIYRKDEGAAGATKATGATGATGVRADGTPALAISPETQVLKLSVDRAPPHGVYGLKHIDLVPRAGHTEQPHHQF